MPVERRAARMRRGLDRASRAGEHVSDEPPDRMQKLAAAIGNRAFAHVVHGRRVLLRDEERDARPMATIKPRRTSTDWGEFLVYPNTKTPPPANYHELPPGVAGPVDAFRVTEATFARINRVLTTINTHRGWLLVDGTRDFKARVLRDLAWLLTSSVGQELLNALAKTGHGMSIKETKKVNTIYYWEGIHGGSRPNEDGTPGAGCDVEIHYNPRSWDELGTEEAWMRTPPAIGLAHELVHGWAGMAGVREEGTISVDGAVQRRTEMQATGLGPWATARFSENKFLAAFGLPLRPRYTR